MFDSNFSLDKGQQERVTLNTLTRNYTLYAINRKLSKSNQIIHYSDGVFDGKIGNIADKKLIEFSGYRAGYQEGIIEYYLKKYRIELGT